MRNCVFSTLLICCVLATAGAPATAEDWCWDVCTATSSCHLDCQDMEEEGNGVFDSTCGEYGLCYSPPPTCQDPKSVTTRVDTTLLNSTVTGTYCFDDHWYYSPNGPPIGISPKIYEQTSYSFRHSTFQVTTFCSGAVQEFIISISYSVASCAKRTEEVCGNPFGYPGLTCL